MVLKCDVDPRLTRGNVRSEMAICYLLWNRVKFYRAKYIINKAMFSFTNQDICKISKPCQNGATCKLKNDGYTCLCKPGYQGVNCEQGRNEKQEVLAFSTMSNFGFTCTCFDLFSDVNECNTRPCLNGGTCQNLPGSYKCNCKPGFIGKHCETGKCTRPLILLLCFRFFSAPFYEKGKQKPFSPKTNF